MKSNLLFLLWISILMSCADQQVNEQKPNTDTLNADLSNIRIDNIFNNSFRDINNFSINVGNKYVDSLHSLMINTETNVIRDICVGDNCESYQIIANRQNNTVFYFFKGDSYEYGFSNDQYFMRMDTFLFVRNYNVSIYEWPTDSTETIWKVEELTYEFYKDSVFCKTRRAFMKELGNFDFTLKNATSELLTCDLKNIYKEKQKELKLLLALKDSENRD